jgi:hypothetical protein
MGNTKTMEEIGIACQFELQIITIATVAPAIG